MAKANSTWKSVERAFGALFGGERNPISGRIRDSGIADMEVQEGIFSNLSFEIKHRSSLPSWLFENAFDQADKAKRKIKKYSAILLHKKGQKYEDSFVLMRVKDFVEYSQLISGTEPLKYYKIVSLILRSWDKECVVGKCTSEGLDDVMRESPTEHIFEEITKEEWDDLFK